MDKKARRIDAVQNLAIVLLSVSAVFLLLQTPLFGNFPDGGLSSLFAQSSVSSSGAVSDSLTAPAPVRIVLSNSFVRRGEDSSTGAELFESSAGFLGEAIASAADEVRVSKDEFLSQLLSPGLYFDFYSSLPLEVLASRLGISAPGIDLPVRRCLLSPEGGAVALYVEGEDSCARFSCSVSVGALGEYLDMQEGNGAEFAAALGEEYSHLSPFTLVPGEVAPRKVLTSSNPLADFDNTDVLSCAEFNPHNKDRYAESSGTVVILEGERILRLHGDGTVVYSGGSAESDSLYRASSSERASRAEALSAARKLLASLLQGRTGSASLYLHSVETNETGYRLFFDYLVGGTPLLFSDGTHAAEISVNGASITAFTVHCRRYAESESNSLLLPAEQAAAVSRIYGGGELSIAYIDSLGDSVSADWITD